VLERVKQAFWLTRQDLTTEFTELHENLPN